MCRSPLTLFFLGQSVGDRAVGLSPKPLHKARAPEENAHLHRLSGFSLSVNSTGSNDFLISAGSTAGALCVWFHPLALHQDDLPCCPSFVPPCQVTGDSHSHLMFPLLPHLCYFAAEKNHLHRMQLDLTDIDFFVAIYVSLQKALGAAQAVGEEISCQP